MKLKYNNQELSKVNYNGKYVNEVIYNGTVYCFGSYNETALQSFSNRPTISASINNCEAIANLYNGAVKVLIPDVTFGNEALGLSVGHIYNSMMDNDEIYAAKWTFIGKGFKINYQQYLIKVNSYLYYYIDGAGTKHEIIPAKNGDQNGKTFYDTSGLGLILGEENNSLLLTDRSNNKMYFDKLNGLIIKTENNLGHKTIMAYDNLRLMTVTKTAVNKSRTMHFAYDELDRLKTISYDGANKTVIYNYKQNSNLLESIIKRADQVEELIVKLDYTNNKLTKITNLAYQTITLLYYSNDKIDTIKEGITRDQSYIFEQLKIRKIIYNQNNTEVRTTLKENVVLEDTKSQVRMVYNFNYKGIQTTVYEAHDSSFTSILPASNIGTRLMEKVNNVSTSSFNGVNINSVNQNSQYENNKGFVIQGLSENNIKAITQSIKDSKVKQTYTLSFWYQVLAKPIKNPKVRMYFSDNDYIEKEITKLDSNWNFISLEKYFPVSFTCSYIKVYLVAERNETFQIKLSDFRAINNTSSFEVTDIIDDIDIRKIYRIRYNPSFYSKVDIKDVRDINNDNEYFITVQDLIWNLNEKFKQNRRFYVNNGQRMFETYVDYIIDMGNNVQKIIENSLQNPFMKNVMYKDKDTKVETFIYYEQVTSSDYNLFVRTNGIGKDYTTRTLKKYNKVNQLLEEIDEYDVHSIYYYDGWGNVKSALKQPLNNTDNSLKLYQENNIDENGNIKQSTTANNVATQFDVDGIYGNIKTLIDANKKLKTEYQYDSFKDNVMNVNHYTINNGNSTLYNGCTINYNSIGQLSSVVRNDQQRYSYYYDAYGNLEHYRINGKVIEGIDTIYKLDGVEKQFKFANENPDNEYYRSDKYDIYGRLINKEDSGIKYKNVYSDYADKKSSSALLRQINDYYASINYSFNYDMNENLTITSYSGDINGSIEALPAKNNEKQYLYNWFTDNRHTKNEQKITYDDSKIINPRIAKVSFKDPNDTNYISRYSYDKLGRIEVVELSNVKYSYKYENIYNVNGYTSSEKVSTINVKTQDDEFEYNIKYEENNFIKEIKKVNKNNQTSLNSYRYDNLNRLEVESNELLDFTKIYEYDLNGNRKKETTNNYANNGTITNKVFNYNTDFKDRLENIVNSGSVKYFVYDDIGNPTKYKVNTIQANNNMIWERGNLLSRYMLNDKTLNFKYNASGIRINKSIINGNKTIVSKHHLDGTKIVADEVVTYKDNKQESVWMNLYKYDLTGVSGIFVGRYSEMYTFEKDPLGSIIGIYYSNRKIVSYVYDAWGNFKIYKHYSGSDFDFIVDSNPFKWKGYYYDNESGLYSITTASGTGYYDPDTGRYISPCDIGELNPIAINGLNMYIYACINPISVTARAGHITQQNGVCTGGCNFAGGILNSIVNEFNSAWNFMFNDNFRFKSAQYRSSNGWDTSPTIATSWFGRIGYSSYVTKTKGSNGLFYVFAGSTNDVTALFTGGTEYYAGRGINLWNVAGAEVQINAFGLGASVNLFGVSLGVDINLLGATSISIGYTQDLGNGYSQTNGITLGVNTGYLVLVAVGVYLAVTTGDSSILERGWQLIFG